jgi:DNA-binding Xre family transcriptional regulator
MDILCRICKDLHCGIGGIVEYKDFEQEAKK